ncbi:ABC transporter permease [Clostridium algidicarnis]|uniref:Oligopeptide transport system permease protein n=2 Tax=Clostridium algidicarnis TaxID=37659 RepID=A0A2S6FXN9_9CLOT|nr:ABC transporter permease [Clostridium algidicarnis]MBB6630230.1 ABC transporter permease [Clostridium algidicarnis]MBB6698688.1 ABC transporter permease [Clostridium algidicarnis]MBU3203446.1 ABC transporter permease [Clostridium algidicarnis]MBU3206230.1 ABC transporter permease [Clostridium algidicarnis]MBU3211600.1 ABC transporter permease [Clostridium algidicarnis]
MEINEKIDIEMFNKVSDEEKIKDEIVRPSVTYWQDAWRRLKANKLAIVSLGFIIAITLGAIFVPMFSKFDYFSNDFSVANQRSSSIHWFGTDQFGRDLFVRIMYGARYSLTIAYVASFLNFVIGVLYGGIAGYVGGTVDSVMMRIVDIIYSIPMMIYVILLMVIIGPGLKSIIVALAISYWLSMARIVRGEILQLKEQEFVLAARVLGANGKRILLRHLIPNSMGSIIVTLTLLIPSAIFTEAFLSFVGLGIPAPKASWGTLTSEALQGYTIYPYQLIFPSLAICFTILAFNLLGDGLRDALDPKLRK